MVMLENEHWTSFKTHYSKIISSRQSIIFWEYLFRSGARKMACNLYKRGVSDLKAHLDYFEDPTRSCENLNFDFPVLTEMFY